MYDESALSNPHLLEGNFWPREEARRGPSSMLARFGWPRDVWNGLSAVERNRLIKNMRNLITSSHFSGVGSFEMIIIKIVNEINEHLSHELEPPASCHCCDIDKSRQRVLTSYKKQHRPAHVHSDILDRLEEKDRNTIKRDMMPAKYMRRDQKKEMNKKIREFVFDIFDKGENAREAWCAVHKKMCPLWCKAPSAFHGDTPDSDVEDENALSFHAAGVICKDASNQGTMQGDAGPNMVLQHVWCAERRQRKEDLILVECTQCWEPKSAFNYMPTCYRGFSSMLCAGDVGEFVRRDRRQLLMWNLERAPCCLFRSVFA